MTAPLENTPTGSVSIIVAALNEEEEIAATVSTAVQAAKRWFADYEIIVVNDGSTDRTAEIADRLAAESAQVKVIHHRTPQNLGGVYRAGLAAAIGKYVILINGKNDTPEKALDQVFSKRNDADMVIPYTTNTHERSAVRRLVSWSFTTIVNLLSGLRLHYYNHSVLHKTELIKKIRISTASYAMQAEILIKLIKQGATYVEVGVEDVFRQEVRTKAFKLKNILGVLRFLISVAKENRLGLK